MGEESTGRTPEDPVAEWAAVPPPAPAEPDFSERPDERGYIAGAVRRSTPVTPPTSPGQLPARPTRWPTVLGVIAIVVGALGLLANAVAALSIGVMGAVMGGMFSGVKTAGSAGPEKAIQGAMDAMQKYKPLLILIAVAGVVLAGLLITGGVMLLARRRASAPVMRGWSIARLVVAAGGAAVNFMMQREQFAVMANDPSLTSSPGGGMAATMFGVMPLVGALFALLIGWSVPIFMLVWFALPSVRAEVARWKR